MGHRPALLNARTVSVTGQGLPEILGEPALVFSKLSGTERLCELFEYEIELKTPDERNVLYGPGADLDTNALRSQELTVTIALALYGPCETWGLAWAGDWYELERPAAPAQSDNTDPRPWWPDAKQWPSIQHVVDIEQVLARIASPAKPSIAQAPNVDRLLRFATEDLHIRSDTDRRHYATYAAAFGQPFEHHAKLQALWPAVASGEVTLRQAMAQLSTNDWELMRIMARTAKQTQSPTQHG